MSAEVDPARAGRSRRARWRIVALAMVLLGGLVMRLGRVPIVRSWVRGEVDWRGVRVYEFHHRPAVERVDLERVHRRLLPRWFIAQQRVARGRLGASEEEGEAAEAVRAALVPDANLLARFDQMRELAAPSRLAADPRRALYLSWAWSRYLDDRGAPFLMHGAIRGTPSGPSWSVAIYRVLADAPVRVGAGSHRVRLVARADTTSLREQYLGAAGPDDAVVVVDRLREFAFADVWPLLDPWLELPPAARRNFAAAVRREARAQLSEAARQRLRSTAAPRWQITRTLRAIEGRRVSCGRGVRINAVPWYGFVESRLARLSAMAERHATRSCPGITPAEVQTLRAASAALKPDPALESALQELVAWSAQHVAIHEARHLADAERVDGFEEPLACASCASDMGIGARAELSGYLASLAWSPSPALALYQACRSLAIDRRRGGVSEQPHRRALELLQRRLGPVCLEGPPPDLRGLARHLEDEMLGRSDPMALPEDFVARLPVE